MINTVSADMAVILRTLNKAALTDVRNFTDHRMNDDISVPAIAADQVTVRGA